MVISILTSPRFISYNGGAYVTWPRGRRGRGAMWRSGAPQRRGARAAQRAGMYIRAVIRSGAHERRGTSERRSRFPKLHSLKFRITSGSYVTRPRAQPGRGADVATRRAAAPRSPSRPKGGDAPTSCYQLLPAGTQGKAL